jgi:hypothetical protein
VAAFSALHPEEGTCYRHSYSLQRIKFWNVTPYSVVKFTDISEKFATIFRKQSARRKQKENDILLVVCFTHYSTMKTEAIYSFEIAKNIPNYMSHPLLTVVRSTK